ncbi:hypothetical protein N7456_002012 [Penicillium angulare]|uniref:Uncharacterized protein n=1 Tax=Penicillium angulare TaxID=116970 RepID=A0A9W9G7U6_9EURO|nr:hypothetical protein N7456_002012 [Penicillium angulare]
MNLTPILAALSITSIVAAAPIPNLATRGKILPSPNWVMEKMFPHSGIPQLVGKVDKVTGICKFFRLMRWRLGATCIKANGEHCRIGLYEFALMKGESIRWTRTRFQSLRSRFDLGPIYEEGSTGVVPIFSVDMWEF